MFSYYSEYSASMAIPRANYYPVLSLYHTFDECSAVSCAFCGSSLRRRPPDMQRIYSHLQLIFILRSMRSFPFKNFFSLQVKLVFLPKTSNALATVNELQSHRWLSRSIKLCPTLGSLLWKPGKSSTNRHRLFYEQIGYSHRKG